MDIQTLDWFKIPEGIRIPYFGGRLYNYLSKKECRYIQRLPVSALNPIKCRGKKEKIIVSLTSFPARIETVVYSIKSLMNQTLPPDRIILWLADSQFPSHELPDVFKDLSHLGLEIRYVEDLKSHKKYHFALKQQQEDELVITYDDDIIYPEDSIERLYNTHLMHPDCIVCNRAAEITVVGERLGEYCSWRINSPAGVKEPSMRLFPSTGGGTLYPFGSVNKEVYNIENMKKIAFTADDLWMRFMSALNGTQIIKTRRYHKTFTVFEGSQVESLQVENCIGNGNDEAIARLSKQYPEALERIIHGC